MAINYQISRWRSQFEERAADFTERKRLDAALQELWRQIYEMLEANGLLDRPVALRLRKEFLDYQGKLTREGLRLGYFRRDEFLLREDDKLGEKVIFRQSRADR
jgi:hypothetical protein